MTTPQEAGREGAVKAAKMAQMTKQRVLGVVENMAYYVCPDCGSRHYIFGRGGAFEIARAHGHAPPRPHPARRGHARGRGQGAPAALDPSSPVGAAFADIAKVVSGEAPEPADG